MENEVSEGRMELRPSTRIAAPTGRTMHGAKSCQKSCQCQSCPEDAKKSLD